MNVWCVMEYDHGGAYLVSVWLTEELAKAEAERLKKNLSVYALTYNSYDVEEWTVQDG